VSVVLPVLSSNAPASDRDLLRLFYKTEIEWARHLGEETALEIGTAFANCALDRIADANRIMDVACPGDLSPIDLMTIVDTHFASQKSRCLKYVPNISAAPEQTARLVDHLRSRGFWERQLKVMKLDRYCGRPSESPDIQVVPARAVPQQTRALMADAGQQQVDAQVVEARIAHLDDGRYDLQIALTATPANDREPTSIAGSHRTPSRASACAGVLAVGEIGLIEQLFVASFARRQGLGTFMMHRAIEVCARSMFKHVLLSVEPDNDVAISLYSKLGFREIGIYREWCAPDATAVMSV